MEQSRIAIAKAVDLAGSQAELARQLGVKQQHIWNWLNKNLIPAERAIDIEELFDGFIRVEELRPDVNWHVIRKRTSIRAKGR